MSGPGHTVPTMFVGTIPDPMRSIVRETAATWPKEFGLWVPCAGNFTIERSVGGLGFALHSSDVSIYTSAVGNWLAGQHVELSLKPEAAEQFDWLADSLDGGVGSIATLMLGTRFLGSAAKAAEGHPYHLRVVESYRRQWAQVHAATVEKLTKADTPKLSTYEAEDVVTWLDRVPEKGPVCTFPPFYGSGYETLYKPLEATFDWPAPDYTILSDEDVVNVLEKITGRPYWLTASNHNVDELAPFLRGRIQATPRAAPFYVYAAAKARLVAPNQKIEPVRQPRLRPGVELTGRLSFAKLSPGQFNALRSKYLNPKIPPGAALLPIAVLDAGNIVGVAAVNRDPYDPSGMYLLSDFAVAPTDYKNPAKLVLLAFLSAEGQRLMESSVSGRVRRVTTTAFTNNPVSMKYRNVGVLTKRSESKDPNWKYQLQYEFPVGTHTLAEAWAKWSTRWGQKKETP